MAIISVNGISGINSITSQSGTVEFYNSSGALASFTGNISGNINASGITTLGIATASQLQVTGLSTFSNIRVTGGTISGVSTAGITTAYIGSVNDGPISGARNRIINGSMSIDQRNAGGSVSVTDGTYTVDRFKYVGSSSRITAQRTSSSPPTGFDYSLLLTSVGANTPGAGEANGIWQIIEANNVVDFAYGTSSAKTSILSFWVKSSSAATYGGAIQNASLNRSYPFSYTINSANTWEYKTIIITGDTTGSWNTTGTSGGITVVFSTGAAAAYKGTANTWASADYRDVTGTTNLQATNGATLNITGVQLESGTVATPFERRSYGQELALCQRYYAKSYKQSVVPGANDGDGCSVFYSHAAGTYTINGNIIFPVEMRAEPTVNIWSNSGTSGQFTASDSIAKSGSAGAVSQRQASMNVTSGNNNVTYRCQWVAAIEL